MALSPTLKNLKFMQRGLQRVEKVEKQEEGTTVGNFPSTNTSKKCVVIMEGDPHPSLSRGRMSFQSFNTLIDKLNQEADTSQPPEGSIVNSTNQGHRENGSAPDESETLKSDRKKGSAKGDLKRKQSEVLSEIHYPNNSQGDSASVSGGRYSHKKHKREKLDWNLLRPPMSRN